MKTFLSIFLVCWSAAMFAQTNFIPAPPFGTICPGSPESFSVSAYGSTSSGNYVASNMVTWTLTNARFGNDASNNPIRTKTVRMDAVVDVTFDDVQAVAEVQVSGPCGTVKKQYSIRSLAGKTPANILKNPSVITFCNAPSVSVQVDQMNLTNTGGVTGVPQAYAEGYEWSIPAGWKHSIVSAPPSGATTATTQEPFITIVALDGCKAGSISVRGYVTCSGAKRYSSSASIALTRTEPGMTLTPQGGSFSASCGVTSGVTFTANHSLNCVSSYQWSFPSGWTPPTATTAGNSITATPSGSQADAGVVSVTAVLVCGATVTRSYTVQFIQPGISITSVPVCSTSPKTVQLSNVSPAVSVSWSAPAGLNLTSPQGGLSMNVMAPYYGEIGYRTITASFTCGAIPTTKNISVYVGTPSQPRRVIGSASPSVGGIYPYSASPSQGAAYYDWWLPYNGNPLWSVAGGTVSGPVNTTTPNFMAGSATGFVQCIAYNECGSSGASKLRVTPTGGGGGQIPRMNTNPNPATDEFQFDTGAEGVETKVELLNSQMEVVRDGRFTDRRGSFKVGELSTGTYYLRITTPDEVIIERVVVGRRY